ncbi:hypothetical protein ACLI09_07545 [Flavobacterium sp. RHBU_24]|uniref:hypothetical protein n=1 Tax=Flavobacterium sp. RHBU_24 TaxID=3391185 RepID=UPI003985333E
MKTIVMVLLGTLLLLSGCSPDVFIDVKGPEAERPLPIAGIKNSFKKVIPNKHYDYWALMQNGTYGKQEVLYRWGHATAKRGFLAKSNGAGIDIISFNGNYIFAMAANKPHYFYNAEQFAEFLGTIDNVDEALILAACHGFKPDNKLHADTFYHRDTTYVLRLTDVNFVNKLYTDEVVEVTVTKNGFIKTRSVWQRKADPNRFK